jgi:hypothetical protein
LVRTGETVTAGSVASTILAVADEHRDALAAFGSVEDQVTGKRLRRQDLAADLVLLARGAGHLDPDAAECVDHQTRRVESDPADAWRFDDRGGDRGNRDSGQAGDGDVVRQWSGSKVGVCGADGGLRRHGAEAGACGVATAIRERHAALGQRPCDHGVDRLLTGRVSHRYTGRRDQQRQSDHHGAGASHVEILFSGVIGADLINTSHYIHFCNSKCRLRQLSLVDDGFLFVP